MNHNFQTVLKAFRDHKVGIWAGDVTQRDIIVNSLLNFDVNLTANIPKSWYKGWVGCTKNGVIEIWPAINTFEKGFEDFNSFLIWDGEICIVHNFNGVDAHVIDDSVCFIDTWDKKEVSISIKELKELVTKL